MLRQLDEAVKSYHRAIQLKPGYLPAYNNLGMGLRDLDQREESIQAFNSAIKINPEYAEAYFNRGNVFFDLQQLEKAIESYEKAISINPQRTEWYLNIVNALKLQGKLDQASDILKKAFETGPENNQVIEYLIDDLNYGLADTRSFSIYGKAQESLLKVTPNHPNPPIITDQTVQQVYIQCQNILDSFGLINRKSSDTQIWRGVICKYNCPRYKKIFNTFKVIPEFCFDCHKVLVEPRTVIELFKLMLIFDELKLPKDNTRKCLVEVRPNISGTYKGLIYCSDIAESKQILKITQKIVGERISKDIPISVKRGCSEHLTVFPNFVHTDSMGQFQMKYNKEWRRYEHQTDKTFVEHVKLAWCETHNHSGLTLLDALIMKTWIAYAETIGDLDHLKITKSL